jgi:PKD repeat protein
MRCHGRFIRPSRHVVFGVLLTAVLVTRAQYASAVYLESRLLNPVNNLTEAIDSTSTLGPVDIAGQIVLSSGTITYSDSTDHGQIRVSADHYKANSQCIEVGRRHIGVMRFEDVIFTCPDSANVNVRLNLEIEGHAAFLGPRRIGFAQLDLNVDLANQSRFIGRWIARSSLTSDICTGVFASIRSDSLSGIFTTPIYRVPVGVPVTLVVRTAADVNAGGCNRIGGDRTQFNFSGEGRRIGFPDDGPVFVLPPGCTVHSGSAHFDDNLWRLEPPNVPPTCEAGSYAGQAGLPIAFDGSGSSDVDGGIVSYEWDFGDGASGSGASVEHVYAQPGSYVVSLCVVDDDGVSSCCSGEVNVAPPPNVAPVCAAGGPYAAVAGVPVALDASGSSDGDGAIVSYAWDFGDGSNGSGASVEHVYSQPGNYVVSLCVVDDDGASSCCASEANVAPPANGAPACDAGGPYAGVAGVAIAFDASGSSDADGSIVSYGWDFGDGSSGSGATVEHVYSQPGNYVARVCVVDDDGDSSCCDAEAVVDAPPPAQLIFDAHPGSCPNPLNPKSRGQFPAALIGSPSLPVSQIDLQSLRLQQSIAPVKSAVEDVAASVAPTGACECVSSAPDGIPDLMLHFDTQAIVAALDPSVPLARGAQITLTLSGALLDGSAFVAQDCVVLVQAFEPPPPKGGNSTGRKYALAKAEPNPTNSSSEIRYSLESAAHVRVTIYDASGRVADRLVDANLGVGDHAASWDASSLPSGIYFYRLEVDGQAQNGKIIVAR